MNYYEEKQRVYNVIETLLRKSGDEGLDEDYLIYDLTKRYSIGEGTLKKRLDLLKKLNIIVDVEGCLIWKKKKSH